MRTNFVVAGAVSLVVGTAGAAPLGAQPAAPMPTLREVHYYNPAWSPDGRWISYESDADGKFAIHVAASDGTGHRKLTSGAADDVQATWSPDGQRLVFTSNRTGRDQLHTMLADGSLQRPLNVSDTRDFYATWSRDGKEVLFAAQDAHNRMLYYIGIVNADGTNRRILTDSTASAEGPRWTRDGARIAFTRAPILQRNAGETPREFIARRNKASERQFIDRTGARIMPPPGIDLDGTSAWAPAEPALSPDGRRLAVPRVSNGHPGIVLIDVQTGEVVAVIAGGSAKTGG